MHLDHLRYRRYVDAYVDGELHDDLRERVDGHVAMCPMCSRAADLTVHVKHSLARRRGMTERAAKRIRRWARGELN